ncbi:hypothetical protein HHK36_024225 [Tetracentron sinense]|uniref:Potassium channel n=1 Tax=Tetracentron sinense TaxID=13715 RepID=A0A834YQ57_TETSI|nr:hypothetical protein HHK36_024225 [Tetracentron sinense]
MCNVCALYATGYGEIHAVNLREMIFVMIYVSLDMVLGAYLLGNMTALIVKGSKTERFRDKMTDVIKYMNRNGLEKDIRNQVKDHFRLQYERSYTEDIVLQDIPVSIRAKDRCCPYSGALIGHKNRPGLESGLGLTEQISQDLYKPCIAKVDLFKGCSSEFINQIDKVSAEGDESKETIVLPLQPNSSFGEISILCNIAQPYTVRVRGLCMLLRLDKQSFTNILEMHFSDGRTILTNFLERKESNVRIKQLESAITLHIEKQEAELALRLNSAAYNGDLDQLKRLIQAGADPNKTDYDGRSPLHLAASRGFEDITSFLIQKGVGINISDNFRSTPLLEAIKSGYDGVASLLVKEGAELNIDDAGSCLCMTVARGDSDFLKRVLFNGIDPNSKDYDNRTPLHVAASKGLYLMAKLLLEAGASVFSKDRWGNTPLDEGRTCGNKNLIKLLEDAKSTQLSDFPGYSQEIQGKMHPRTCTVFPFHPWDPKEERKQGVVLWVPHTIEELIKMAVEQLKFSGGPCILSEDAGKILDVNMINDGKKLYLVNETPSM